MRSLDGLPPGAIMIPPIEGGCNEAAQMFRQLMAAGGVCGIKRRRDCCFNTGRPSTKTEALMGGRAERRAASHLIWRWIALTVRRKSGMQAGK